MSDQYVDLPIAGTAGAVTNVTATSPLASSGGTTPDISLAGIVSVAHGGTSLATLTANNVILGNGASAPSFVAPSTSGNVLTSNGTTWLSTAPAASGVQTMGAFGSSPNSAGGTISGTTLTLQPADSTNPGGVSTLAQSLKGLKNFVDGLTIPANKNAAFSSVPADAYITDEGASTIKIHSDGGHLNMYVNAAETAFLGFSTNKAYFHGPAVAPACFYVYGGDGRVLLGCNSDAVSIIPFTKGYSSTWLAQTGSTAGYGFTFSDGSSASNDDLDTRIYSPAVNQITVQAGNVDVIKTTSSTVNLPLLTASQAVFTDSSKNLVSNAITGSGNVVMSASPTLTGTITAAAIATSAQRYQSALTTNTPSGTTQTIDFNNGNIQTLNLGSASGNVTVSFSNPQIARYVVLITQGATPRTVTWPTVKWTGTAAPTLTGTASSKDTVEFVYDGSEYRGYYALNQA